MAKRRTMNRLSKRFSKHKSIDSNGSGYLDPDTNDTDEERTLWWNNLEDDTLPYSLRNDRNETTKQLSSNSQLDSAHSTIEWWKNLRSSDNEHNASTSLRQNFSAAIVETNVLEISTSESEKGYDLKKRKIPLRAASRRSNSNTFLNALDSTQTAAIPLKWRMKQARYSALHSNSDKDTSQRESHENEEDSSNLSLTVNILKSKPNIFKKKKSGAIEDRNVFQDVLTQDDVLDGSAKIKSIIFEKESSTQQDVENSPRKAKKMSKVFSLESNEPGPSNLSIPNAANAMLENNASDDAIIQSSDESYAKMYNHKVLKLKSHFMQRARRSMGRNAFKDALVDRDISLHNQSQEIDLHDTSPIGSVASSSTKSVNRSKSEINIYGTSSSVRRSPRSSVNAAKKQSLNISMQQDQDNIEQSSSNSSFNGNESHRKTLVSLKPKSRFLGRLRDKSLIKNSFEEVFEENSNTITRKSNAAVPIEDNRISVERNEATIGIIQAHGSLTTEKDSPSNANKGTSEENCDISLKVSSNNERSVINQQSENENELSKSNDIANISKSVSENVITKTLEKQVSSTRKSTRDILMTSKEHTHTNVVLPADKSYTNEIGAYQVLSNDDLFNAKMERDSSASKRLSESSPNKSSSTLKRLSKSSPGKEARLTRISSRNQSETSRLANKEVPEIINNDDLHDNANSDQSSSTHSLVKRLSKSSLGKEARLARNSKNRFETPKPMSKGTSEIINNDDLRDDTNRKQDSSLSKWLFKSSPGKETRLTHNRTRNHSETPKPTDKGICEVMSNDNLRRNINREQNVNTLVRQLFKSSPDKETRLTRNSLRNRLEISKSSSEGASKIINDDLRDDANKEQDSNTPVKRLFKSSPVKEIRLIRSSPRNRSTSKRVREVTSDDDSSDDANKQDPSMLSKLSSSKETRLTRNNLKNRSETPKLSNKDTESKRSIRNDSEESDDISVGFEEIGNDSQVISSTRILSNKVNKNVTANESAALLVEVEAVDNEDVVPATQTIQQNSPLSKEKINKTVNRRPSLILQNSNRVSIKENTETSTKQKKSGFQNRYSTSIKTLSKDINISKINLSTSSKTIDDFFKIKRPAAVDKQSTSNDRNSAPSQVFNAEKMEKIKTELEKIKNREMAAMKMDVATGKKEFALKSTALKQATRKKKLLANPTKVMDKAFLVNGKVYKAPRLPRPKYWVTDHLYKFLWKCMEPKYKLRTRVQSEKFVQELAKMVSLIQRRKKYESYKNELETLMKEMARLKIISTRNDFYNFCQDFLPYEFRVKVVPMLLPGNKKTIPYDPEKLHTPLLDTIDD